MNSSYVPTSVRRSTSSSPLRAWLVGLAGWLWLRPWVLLPLLAVPAIWPFLAQGLPASADGVLHLLRLAVLDHHIGNLVLYPRWVPELSVGLGYPVFNFYGPSTYYLAEALHLLGLDLYHALITAFALLVLFGGFGMYRLAIDILGVDHQWAALVAATAYMFAPYLLTNVFVRGAIAEVGAQALLPWIFWSVRCLMRAEEPLPCALAAAASLGALAITHNITLLLTPLFLLTYALVLWWRSDRQARRIGWLALALGLAMAVSAFFWLPLIGERQYLADVAYRTSAQYLPENVWTWGNFLGTTIGYEYTIAVPVRLGLVQVVLAVAGLVVARRWDGEWLYFIGLMLVAGLGISAWTQPLWLANRTLLVVQFPWRLLSFMSIPLALFTGAILLAVRAKWWQVVSALALCGMVVLANLPRISWMSFYPAAVPIDLPAIAQFETNTGGIGTSSAAEFRPRWVQGYRYEAPGDESPAAQFDFNLQQAGPHGLQAQVTSATGGPLRFTTAYFPGWQATLDDDFQLDVYPSSNLGLLTVDLPAGSHTLRVTWEGTALQRWGMVISLLALAVMAWLAWRMGRWRRWLAAIPLALLILGVVSLIRQAPMDPVQPSQEEVAGDGVRLLGYQVERADDTSLYVRPFWYVQSTPSAETRLLWQLRTEAGEDVAQVVAGPYFNSLNAGDWPPGAVVDDVYKLTLPPELEEGTYRLMAQVVVPGQDSRQSLASVGDLQLSTSTVPQVAPAFPLEVRFGQEVLLAGYDVTVNDQAVTSVNSSHALLAYPGDRVNYALYWRALRSLAENYHGFVHLVNMGGTPLVQHDQLAGSFFRAPRIWDSLYLQPDAYDLRIPEDAPGGLYWPAVGLYDFDTLDRLPVQDDAGTAIADAYRLPPMKVVGERPAISPEHEVSLRLGEIASLLGYDLDVPEAGLLPGSQFTMTLYFCSDAPTEVDYTRFVHLFDANLGMAAQRDSKPQNGNNPTWSWVPGEVIVDRVTLEVAEDAPAGAYALRAGLYDPSNDERVPILDQAGTSLPDRQAVLTTLLVR